MKLRILLVAPEDCTTRGVIGGYCRRALEALGNEVSVYDFRRYPYSNTAFISCIKSVVRPIFPSLPSPYDIPAVKSAVNRNINKGLADFARAYKPDLLLALLGENIMPETLKAVKMTGTVTANWLFDTLHSSRSMTIAKEGRHDYDHLFVIDDPAALKYLGLDVANIHTLPLACDPEIHRRVDLYGSDVAFIGTVTPERERILSCLSGLDLKIWGRWQRRLPEIRKCYRKKDIYSGEAVKVYNASKIILDCHGLFYSGKRIFNVTPRVFEVPASGGFVLTNYAPQVSNLYKIGEEMAVYKDEDEMMALIKYYLSHDDEREGMAKKAHDRAHKEHTYRGRLKGLLETVFNGRVI
ncbi:MAG: glycosyltransferase [Candidatus Omnitrophica bacterium]|nr:glycosyltransferase [Candidatus Omnitrophota bacterium]